MLWFSQCFEGERQRDWLRSMASCTARPGLTLFYIQLFHQSYDLDFVSEIRLDTLDALDELKELSSAEELKNKLLFSVVVVSLLISKTSTGNSKMCSNV